MKFETRLLNELPFMIELQDGTYEVNTSAGTVEITLNSDWYKLHTARFAEYAEKNTYAGDKEKLENTIQKNNISNYAFGPCKTFVSCTFEEEYNISDTDIDNVTEDQCIENIKTLLIRQNVKYKDTDELHAIAVNEFMNRTSDSVNDIKKRIIIDNKFTCSKVYIFYEALNLLLRQSAYMRNFFWIEKLDENTMKGTLIQYFIDNGYYDSTTFVGLAPSFLPNRRIYPDLEEDELKELKKRLLEVTEIPVEEELILVARSLWYRLEYRSAIIESSAALEIVVEKKLIEKMKRLGMSTEKIESELKKTETNFNQRCDHYLKKYARQSFVKDNVELWSLIDNHRKSYRHKIVHSSETPDKKKTEEIINDFDAAIKYINSL